MYSLKAGIPVYRGYNPKGSMEPPWLTFLNQMNHLVQVENCDVVHSFLRFRLGSGVRLGPYLWLSYDELDLLDAFVRETLSLEGLRVSQPYSHKALPWSDVFGHESGDTSTPRELFPWKGLDNPKSVCHSIQQTLYEVQCVVGPISVPTWYAKCFCVHPSIMRSRSRFLKQSGRQVAALMRLHYVLYVVAPRALRPGHRSSQGMRRSHSDLVSHLMWQASRGNRAAVATLHERLKVLLSPLLLRLISLEILV